MFLSESLPDPYPVTDRTIAMAVGFLKDCREEIVQRAPGNTDVSNIRDAELPNVAKLQLYLSQRHPRQFQLADCKRFVEDAEAALRILLILGVSKPWDPNQSASDADRVFHLVHYTICR